ncbi:vomeronasal type-1 receptor 4-like, partial [Eumetopias jubatus]|uniref:vomeronasal type-1 receptor 4-like n=1 Tax=Eumetopias jubatus TaxID=34886 RepID=UPI0010169C0F
MTSRDLALATIFLLQMIVGIPGNFSLLYQYLCHYYIEGRLRPTDLLLEHLVIANSLLMLLKRVPQTLAAFGLKYFFHDSECTLLLYVQRAGRGVSIDNTCLLSVQTIMISPVNSCWKDLKVRAPKYAGFSISLCWNIYMMVTFNIPMYVLYVSGKWSSRNITKKRDFRYCSTYGCKTIVGSLFAALVVFPEVSLSGLKIWASGSMIFILHRHRQQVQHIHRTNVSPRSSAESRATQSTLVLVSTYVSFSFLSSILHVRIALLDNPSWWLVNTTDLISVGFPNVSPFLIMRQDSTVSRLCIFLKKNTK